MGKWEGPRGEGEGQNLSPDGQNPEYATVR